MAKEKGGWSSFPHDADLGIEGRGKTMSGAFEQAAIALLKAITDQEVKCVAEVRIACAAADPELLFVEWIDSLIYEMAVRNMLFGRVRVKIEGDRLTALAWGEPLDPVKHRPACEPKAATLTELHVGRDDDGVWRARCVVDV
jgi:tRNA nucleotidyltransferase (CCA-adding enzyme)